MLRLALFLWLVCAPSLALAEVVVGARALDLTTSSRFTSVPISLDRQTADVEVRIQRPTTLVPVAWGATDKLEVHLVVIGDGIEYRATGRASGGIRTGLKGEEVEFYRLHYTLPWGYFGARSGNTKRLGEHHTTLTAHVDVIRPGINPIATAIVVDTVVRAAPVIPFRSSVAFDNATDGFEVTGDGILSVTHTATGSNRGAFAGNAHADGGGVTGSTSVTYAGSGMTENLDATFFAGPTHALAIYSLAAPSTGAQTVTSTVVGTPNDHYLGVITMTGVHQTTPVGTAVSASNNVSPATATVASVGTDDLVIDNMLMVFNDGSLTIGADQTERNAHSAASFVEYRQSTQPGTAGGVMSWTFTDIDWATSAIAFKPSADAAAPTPQRTLMGVGT